MNEQTQLRSETLFSTILKRSGQIGDLDSEVSKDTGLLTPHLVVDYVDVNHEY